MWVHWNQIVLILSFYWYILNFFFTNKSILDQTFQQDGEVLLCKLCSNQNKINIFSCHFGNTLSYCVFPYFCHKDKESRYRILCSRYKDFECWQCCYVLQSLIKIMEHIHSLSLGKYYAERLCTDHPTVKSVPSVNVLCLLYCSRKWPNCKLMCTCVSVV